MAKSITSFRQIHNNSDIYVIASGKSLDFVPTSFFNDKITIGVNQIFKKFQTTYLVYKDPKFLNIAAKNCKNIFISKYMYGNTKHRLNDVSNIDNCAIYDHNCNTGTDLIDFTDITNKIIVSHSTITTAMHIAAYLGAKNIILVGHDCGLIDGESNFKNYYSDISDTPWKHWDEYKQWLLTIESQTLSTKNMLKSVYSCNIMSLNPFINYNLEGHSFKSKNNIN